MTDVPPGRDPKDDAIPDTGVGRGRGAPIGTPRWVKVFGIIAAVLILLFVINHLAGGGIGSHTP
ncbi:hypothetical protein ACQCSX_17685 [Pseudarthrobacter sp. P1]|uniref:hypothetical protein n=1 Tax=Pseudarthrobacter sp. P1 TaxID=3418418 RepID=UPI003CE6EE90